MCYFISFNVELDKKVPSLFRVKDPVAIAIVPTFKSYPELPPMRVQVLLRCS